MQLLHGHTKFLDGILLFNAGAKKIRLHDFHQFFRLVLVKIVDNQSAFVHIHCQAVILLELVARLVEGLKLLVAFARSVAAFVRFDFELLDVAAISIKFDVGQHLAAFIVILMAKLIARRDGLHAKFIKELLVMVGPRTADKHHDRLFFGAGQDIEQRSFNGRHLFSDNLFNLVDKLLFAEVAGNLAQRLGRGLGADEIHLDPWYAVLGLHHVRHIVDGAVAHNRIEVRGMGGDKLVIGGVSGKGRDAGDPAFLEDPVNLETVATDVILTQQVDLILARFHLVILTDKMAKNLIVGNVMPGRLADPLIPFTGKSEDITVPEFFLHVLGDRVDVITDQTHWTGGKYGD